MKFELRFIAGLVAVCLWHLSINAQEPARDADSATGVTEVAPRTIYLKDDNGKLVPVPGISYEKFRDLLLLERKLAGEGPAPITLERMLLEGSLQNLQAKLYVEIQGKCHAEGWHKVQLSMPTAFLSEAATSENIELVHTFEPKIGHSFWLKGTVGKNFSLKMPLVTEVSRLGVEHELTLQLPVVGSIDLNLFLPERIAQAKISAGEGLLERVEEGEQTRIKVRSAVGKLGIVWQTLTETEVQRTRDLEATSQINMRLETRDVVTLQANLKLKRSASNIQTVFVRYPPRFEANLQNQPEFTLRMANAEELKTLGFTEKKTPNGTVIRIDLVRPVQSCELNLTADYLPETTGKKSPYDLSGFEVYGAERQTGQFSIDIPTGWTIKPITDAAIIRVDDTVENSLETRRLTKFRYVKQPFQFKIDIQSQPTRSYVEALHVVRILNHSLQLDTTLRYRIRGPYPEYLEIAPGKWSLTSVEPADVLQVESTSQPEQPIRFSLEPQPEEEFTVRLQFQKPVNETDGELKFDLPKALVTQAMPAGFAFVNNDSWEISPQPAAMKGLLETEQIPGLSLEPAQLLGVYREIGTGNVPTQFVANIRKKSHRVFSSYQSEISFLLHNITCQQTANLKVLHEPLDHVIWELPSGTPVENINFFLGSEEVEAVSTNVNGQLEYKVVFPQPISGVATLQCNYQMPLSNSQEAQLPLLLLRENENWQFNGQEISWNSPKEYPWQLLSHKTEILTSSNDENVAQWNTRNPIVSFEKKNSRISNSGNLSLEKAWLQMFFLGNERRDRLVARFHSSGNSIELELPHGIKTNQTRILVNGKVPQVVHWNPPLLQIEFEPQEHAIHTLDLGYFLESMPPQGIVQNATCELPRFTHAEISHQFLLQVVTPRNRQIFTTPSGFTSFNQWRRAGWFWKRSGAFSDTELQQSFGVPVWYDDLLPTQQSLFVTFSPERTIHVSLTETRWVTLISASVVILVGWMLYWLTFTKRWAWLFFLGFSLVVLVFLDLELAMNLSIALGMGLVLLMASLWSSFLLLQYKTSPTLPPRAFVNPNESRSKYRGGSSVESTMPAATFPEARS